MGQKEKKTKFIMVQGTMSNAGKSLVAAGLCRLLHQEGFRVAPFKSQNMALNSFITREGFENANRSAINNININNNKIKKLKSKR